MNYFGLSYGDIVRSFNGAIEDDFATGGRPGSEVIEREMDLQIGDILTQLDPVVLRLLEQISGMKIDWKQEAITYSFTPVIPPIAETIKVYLDVEQVFRNIRSCSVNPPLNCTHDVTDLQIFTDYTIEYGTYGQVTIVAGASMNPDYDYYISYEVDQQLINIPSLASYLRNKVCCILGHQLYSRQDSSWKLVDHYCKLAEHSLKGFIPPELKKLKWYRYPFNIGIVSQRWVRG